MQQYMNSNDLTLKSLVLIIKKAIYVSFVMLSYVVAHVVIDSLKMTMMIIIIII